MVSKNFWGQSLHLNLHNCDKETFSKKSLEVFCKELCKEIKMTPHGKAMVERFGSGKLLGNSALQFIETSSISIHTDEFFGRVFIDIFSCQKFDRATAKRFCKIFFGAKDVTTTNLVRK